MVRLGTTKPACNQTSARNRAVSEEEAKRAQAKRSRTGEQTQGPASKHRTAARKGEVTDVSQEESKMDAAQVTAGLTGVRGNEVQVAPAPAAAKMGVTDTTPEVDGAGPGNSALEAADSGAGDRTAGGPVREAPTVIAVKMGVTDTVPEVDGDGPGNSAPEADGTEAGVWTAGGSVREAPTAVAAKEGVTHTAPEVDGAGLGNSAPETDGAGLGNDASETDGHLEMCGGQEGGAGDEVEVARNGNGIDNGRRGFPEHGFPDRGLPERDSRAGFRSGIPERDSGTRSLGSASGGARVRTVERSPVVADPYRTTGRTCGRAVFRDGIPERDSGAGFRSGLPAVEVIVGEVDTAAVGPVGGENPDVVETDSGSGSDRRGFPERGMPERDFGAGFRSGISEQNFGAEFRSRIPERETSETRAEERGRGPLSGGLWQQTLSRGRWQQRPAAVAAAVAAADDAGSRSAGSGLPERDSGAGFRSGILERETPETRAEERGRGPLSRGRRRQTRTGLAGGRADARYSGAGFRTGPLSRRE